MAETKETKEKKEELSAEKQAQIFLNEKVTLRLFKDSGKYKDDLTVCVNGRIWKIKRGIEVQVPRYVLMVIQESMEQGECFATLVEKGAEDYETNKKLIGG